jgi:RNA polymerase subunit RPABC4/transcription elongation factor Spt4
MAPLRACKKCKKIIESGSKCPKCGSEEISDNAKGIVHVLKPEESDIAKNLKLNEKGSYTIKT